MSNATRSEWSARRTREVLAGGKVTNEDVKDVDMFARVGTEMRMFLFACNAVGLEVHAAIVRKSAGNVDVSSHKQYMWSTPPGTPTVADPTLPGVLRLSHGTFDILDQKTAEELDEMDKTLHRMIDDCDTLYTWWTLQYFVYFQLRKEMAKTMQSAKGYLLRGFEGGNLVSSDCQYHYDMQLSLCAAQMARIINIHAEKTVVHQTLKELQQKFRASQFYMYGGAALTKPGVYAWPSGFVLNTHIQDNELENNKLFWWHQGTGFVHYIKECRNYMMHNVRETVFEFAKRGPYTEAVKAVMFSIQDAAVFDDDVARNLNVVKLVKRYPRQHARFQQLKDEQDFDDEDKIMVGKADHKLVEAESNYIGAISYRKYIDGEYWRNHEINPLILDVATRDEKLRDLAIALSAYVDANSTDFAALRPGITKYAGRFCRLFNQQWRHTQIMELLIPLADHESLYSADRDFICKAIMEHNAKHKQTQHNILTELEAAMPANCPNDVWNPDNLNVWRHYEYMCDDLLIILEDAQELYKQRMESVTALNNSPSIIQVDAVVKVHPRWKTNEYCYTDEDAVKYWRDPLTKEEKKLELAKLVECVPGTTQYIKLALRELCVSPDVAPHFIRKIRERKRHDPVKLLNLVNSFIICPINLGTWQAFLEHCTEYYDLFNLTGSERNQVEIHEDGWERWYEQPISGPRRNTMIIAPPGFDVFEQWLETTFPAAQFLPDRNVNGEVLYNQVKQTFPKTTKEEFEAAMKCLTVAGRKYAPAGTSTTFKWTNYIRVDYGWNFDNILTYTELTPLIWKPYFQTMHAFAQTSDGKNEFDPWCNGDFDDEQLYVNMKQRLGKLAGDYCNVKGYLYKKKVPLTRHRLHIWLRWMGMQETYPEIRRDGYAHHP